MLEQPDRKKWMRWLDQIIGEIVGTAIDQHVFSRWMEAVRANPKLDVNNRLLALIWASYMERQVLTIRRQLDEDKSVASLARLIGEIAAYAPQLGRQAFLQAYTKPEYVDTWREADEFFNTLADPARPDVISREIVQGHLEELRILSSPLLLLADKWLAHSDQHRTWPEVSFGTLDRCLNLLYLRFQQYSELVNQSPVVADIAQLAGADWEPVLDIPWRAQ